MRWASRRLAVQALVVVLTLLASACESDDSRGDWDEPSSGGGQPAIKPIESVDLAPLPDALPLTGAPADQAAMVVDAFRAGGQERLAATVAAFRAAGVPILDPEGRSLTTDPADDIGIPWFLVIADAGASTPGTGVTVGDLMTVFGADQVEPVADRAAVSGELLDGLRDGLGGHGDVRLQFVAALVRQEGIRARGVDLADPAVTADEVVVSMPTALLLVSAAIRTALLALAVDSDTRMGGETIGPQPSPAPPAPPQLPPGCATDSAGQWAIWLASKVTAGANIGGIGSFTGIYSTLVNHLVNVHGVTTSAANAAQNASKIAAWANAAINATSLVVALLTLSSSAELEHGEPLVRTQTTRPGEDDVIDVKVFYDYGKLDPATLDAINCILSLLSIVGNNNTLPSPGAASGVEVTVTGLYGFADRLDTSQSLVLFGPEGYDPRQTADDQGMVKVPVQGREQRKDISRPTPSPVRKVFAINVQSTADPVDENTITKTFLDSFLCAGAGLTGGAIGDVATECLNPLVDIIKQFNWDVGAWEFKLTDWESCAATTTPQRAPVCTADSTITFTVEQHAVVDLNDDSGLYDVNNITHDGTYTVTIDAQVRREDDGWVDNGSSYTVSGAVTSVQRISGGGGAVDCTGTTIATYSGHGKAAVGFVVDPGTGSGTFGVGGTHADVRSDTTVAGQIKNPYGGEDLSCEGVTGTTGSDTAGQTVNIECPINSGEVRVPYTEGARSVDVSCTDTADIGYGTVTYSLAGALPLP